jgi:hypothetical protein
MPIYHAVEQNTPEWIQMRLGIPCSSEFDKIITPKTRKLSSQAMPYMYRLLAEWVTGAPCENHATEWMDRGHDLESSAVANYEFLTGADVKPGGFVTTDDGLIGCSPDGLIGENGDLELKCPLIQTQVKYALTGEIDEAYMAQLQGRLMIHGREWVDIYPYHPLLRIPAVRVCRDEAFISALSAALREFLDLMLAKREELNERFGPFVRMAPQASEYDGRFGLTVEDGEKIIAAYHAEGRFTG